jgi:hypothetical protein
LEDEFETGGKMSIKIIISDVIICAPNKSTDDLLAIRLILNLIFFYNIFFKFFIIEAK